MFACKLSYFRLSGTIMAALLNLFELCAAATFVNFPLFCSCVAWMSYGKLNGNMTLIMVNAVGATLQIIYLAVFLSVAKEKVCVV